METTERHNKKHTFAMGLAIGIPIGMPVGLAMGNLALGPAIGLVIGVILGFVLKAFEGYESTSDDGAITGRNKIWIYLIIFGIVVFFEVLIYWLMQYSDSVA